MRRPLRLSCLVLLLCATAGTPLGAASNLLEHSPFLPPTVASGAAQENAPLEFRSLLFANGVYEFSLYDLTRKRSTWTTLNELGQDFVVKSFDPQTQVLTVEQRNRTFQLALKAAKTVQLTTAATTLPSASGGPPGPGGATVMPSLLRGLGGAASGSAAGRPQGVPTSAITPEQLHSLEAEIDRRRELRRQAADAPAQQK